MARAPDTLIWVEDLLPDGFLRKPMFGGFAYYIDGRTVLVLFEGSGSKSYRGEAFDFEIWNGFLFPVERENHPEIQKRFPDLIPHPVLKKWLYLPSETEDFENRTEPILREIRRKSPLFGVTPKAKKPKKEKAETVPRMNTSRPMMFRDEPIAQKLASAKKISDLKNLGPVFEKSFHKAGIRTVAQFAKMGWKKTMAQLVQSEPKHLHSLYAYAVIGAINNVDWNGISEKEKAEAREFMLGLRKANAAKKSKAPIKKRPHKKKQKKIRP